MKINCEKIYRIFITRPIGVGIVNTTHKKCIEKQHRKTARKSAKTTEENETKLRFLYSKTIIK